MALFGVGLRSIPASGDLVRVAFAAPLLAAVLSACAPGPTPAAAGPPAAGRGGGAGPSGELALVERFDADGDDRLDAAERAAARAWLTGYRGAGGVGGRGSASLATASPGRRITPSEVPVYPNEAFYDEGTLRTIFLEFQADDWEQELDAFYDTDVEVPATVTVDGVRYPDVGVSFRGATSFLAVPAGSKRSLNLSFDAVHEGQGVGGYRTLNLLNGHNDPTLVRGALYSHVARHYLPTPRINLVRVVINGESWGVYANAQQFNRDFLGDFFDTDEGARWKVPGVQAGHAGLEYLGEDVAAYRPYYEIRSRDDPERWQDLVRLTRLLAETPPERLEAALAPILDVDGVLRFLALEMALVNPDGYWARASDYNLYRHPGGRFHLVPHDINEGFGAETFGGRASPDLDPLTGLDDPRQPLRSRLLAVPALRERYLGYVREIAARWLSWETLGPLAEGYRTLVEEEVAQDTRGLYGHAAFTRGFDDLRRWAEARRAYLLGGD